MRSKAVTVIFKLKYIIVLCKITYYSFYLNSYIIFSKITMQIFLISNMFPSDKDHLFGVFVKNFKNEMEKQGVEFTRAVLIHGKSYSKPKKFFRYSRHFFRVIGNFFGGGYDLFYVHYLTHHIPVLLLLLPFKRKPWIVNVHGSDINGLIQKKYLRFLGGIILRRLDLLVVPTSDFQDMVLQHFPFMKKSQLAVSPSGGVDESRFFPLEGEENETLTLGFVSRLTEEKGWKTFMDALIRLKAEAFPFKAIVGGKGPDEGHIKAYITQNNLEEYVVFKGFIPQEELYKTYNELDVYVFPTFRDSLGLTGLEAMSCGIPVIASRIEGGPTTYVDHGVNGFLFAPKDSLALASAIKNYALMNKKQKREFTEHALKTARHYQRGNVAKALMDNLKSLMSN